MTKKKRRPIQNICIAGKALHVATIAAALSRKFMRQNVNIVAINTEAEDASVLGEVSLSALNYFHRFLGLKEHQMMAVTSSTYKLASKYSNWSCNNGSEEATPAAPFYHSFSSYGSMIDSTAFVHHLTKLRQDQQNYDFTSFSLPAVMARDGKFVKPDVSQTSLPFSYAMHVDAFSYAKGMQDYATKLGVKFVSAQIENVDVKQIPNKDEPSSHATTRKSASHISAIKLSNGARVDAELFIDCTSEGSLIEKALNVGYEDFSDYLPCDRFMTYKGALQQDMKPCTDMSLHDYGWKRNYPLQNRMVYEVFYSSKYLSDEQAVEELLPKQNHAPKNIKDVRIEQQRMGHRTEFFSGNCVSMGSAAGNLDRLAASDFHLVQSAVLRLIDLFPDTSLGQWADNASRNEYNQLCNEEYARILDYHCTHFAIPARKANELSSSFWQAQKQANLPDSLTQKFSLFEASGRIPFYERETFSGSIWTSLLLGLGLIPKQYDVLLDMPPASNARSKSAISNIVDTIQALSDQAPTHKQYLQQYCMRRTNR